MEKEYDELEENKTSKKNIGLIALLSIIVVLTLAVTIVSFNDEYAEGGGQTLSGFNKENGYSSYKKGDGNNKINIITKKEKEIESTDNVQIEDAIDNKDTGKGNDKGKNNDKNTGGNTNNSGSDSGSDTGSSGNTGAGEISMEYTEGKNGIKIVNALPTEDIAGMKDFREGYYFDFNINTKISKNARAEYEVVIVKDAHSTLKDNQIKLYLEQEVAGEYIQVAAPTNFKARTSASSLGAPKGTMTLRTKTVSTTSVDKYRLRMWIDKSASIVDGLTYSVKVNIYGRAIM